MLIGHFIIVTLFLAFLVLPSIGYLSCTFYKHVDLDGYWKYFTIGILLALCIFAWYIAFTSFGHLFALLK